MKTIVFSAIALLVVGCGPRVVATARFAGPDVEPRYGNTPFPNDVFLTNGRIEVPNLEDIAASELEALAAQIGSLDGFGTRPVIELFFDGALDYARIPQSTASADAPLFLVGLADRRVVTVEWRADEKRGAIVGALARGQVLEEGARYAAVATTALPALGGVVAPSEGLRALRTASSVPEGWRTTREALDQLGRDDIVTVAVFTVQHHRRPLLRARDAIARLPPPTITFDDPDVIFAGAERLDVLLGTPARDAEGAPQLGWTSPTGIAHDHVAVLGTGTLHGITYRRPERSGDAGKLPDAGTWELDEDGNPVGARDAAFPVTIALPTGPMPERGYPIAFVMHGLGGSRAQLPPFLETITAAGYAAVAIDADGHGSRHTDRDRRNNVGARIGGGFTGVLEMRDGFGDVEGNATAFDLFHSFVNIAAMRDQMRQSVIDLSQVVLALQNPALDLSPLMPGARVDGSRIVYLGESFGGVLGGLFAAVEPDVQLFYLDVPGGGILDLAAVSAPKLRPAVELFVPSTYSVDRVLDRFDALIGLGAAILDGAEPLAYAPHVLRDRPEVAGAPLPPRHVVINKVVGDEVMPNGATDALALALGLPRASPARADARFVDVEGPLRGNVDGQTAAMVESAPATHGENWTSEVGRRDFMPFADDDVTFVQLPASVYIKNPIRETHEQVRLLLLDHAAGRAPTLQVTAPPRLDFDDDGILDADDPNPYGR